MLLNKLSRHYYSRRVQTTWGGRISRFEGLAQEKDEVPRILDDLGDRHTLIMLNHGQLSVGATLGEAFGYMRALIEACTLQVMAMGTGAKLRRIPDECRRRQRHKSPPTGAMARARTTPWSYWLRLAERLDPLLLPDGVQRFLVTHLKVQRKQQRPK